MIINKEKMNVILTSGGCDDQEFCCLQYVDCRNYIDLASHGLILLLNGYLMYRTGKTIHAMMEERVKGQKLEGQKSLVRKIWVLSIQFMYLSFFMLTIAMSVTIFWFVRDKTGVERVRELNLNKVYKVMEVAFVNFLNTLNLTVGFLYWKATRGYFVLSNQPLPLFYHRAFKTLFFTSYCINISALIIAVVWCCTNSLPTDDENTFTFISVIISILLCVGCRYLHRTLVLSKLKLHSKAIKKERYSSLMLVVSSMLRIAVFSVETAGTDYGIKVREWGGDPQKCIDKYPYNAIIMTMVDLLINLLPAGIYLHLFTTDFRVGTRQISHKLLS